MLIRQMVQAGCTHVTDDGPRYGEMCRNKQNRLRCKKRTLRCS